MNFGFGGHLIAKDLDHALIVLRDHFQGYVDELEKEDGVTPENYEGEEGVVTEIEVVED